MPTDSKPEKTPRSVTFTEEQDIKILKLRELHQQETGKNVPISEVIRKAIEDQADRYGI